MEVNGLNGMGISGTQSANLLRCALHVAVCDVPTNWLVGQYEHDRGAACIMLLHSHHSMKCDDKCPWLLQGLVVLIICALHLLSMSPPCLAMRSDYIQCLLAQLLQFLSCAHFDTAKLASNSCVASSDSVVVDSL